MPEHPDALMFVTGWLQEHGGQWTLQGLPILPPPSPLQALAGQRVTAVARLQTTRASGQVRQGMILRARPARVNKRNGVTWVMLGRLHHIDPTAQTLCVRPITRPGQRRPLWHVRALPNLLYALDPVSSLIRVTGGMIGPLLVAERVEVLQPADVVLPGNREPRGM